MGIMDQVQALARAGKAAEGIALVETAAANDPEAMLVLANWRLWGLYGPRDVAACHRLLAAAGQKGSRDAAILRATVVGNGTGCPADPAAARRMLEPLAGEDAAIAAQLRLLDAMPPESEAATGVEVVSDDPVIRLARNFLSADECAFLMRAAEPALRPSMVIDPHTRRPRPDPVRTSRGMNFGPDAENLVVHAINRRIAALTGTRVECGEPLHVLCYAQGQEFRPHVDAIAGAANQRQWTALVWLNAGYEGGETDFPQIGIDVSGSPGDCLFFRNVDDRGNPEPRMRHAGLPITRGVKWIASRWIRQAPYDAEILR
ncbi:MAG TPA: 2OG-Fe(II) oxygenase [Sphingomicrobium sp.]|nr:2OG-Fe(II) oxygenase [Sphingomicrobium sp.]